MVTPMPPKGEAVNRESAMLACLGLMLMLLAFVFWEPTVDTPCGYFDGNAAIQNVLAEHEVCSFYGGTVIWDETGVRMFTETFPKPAKQCAHPIHDKKLLHVYGGTKIVFHRRPSALSGKEKP